MRKSGGRPSTVVQSIERCPQLYRKRTCKNDSFPTGGLRPPLLCRCTDVCRRNSDFCGAQTHVHKSGGRQPAVVRITHGVREELHNARQLSSPQSRAARRLSAAPWRQLQRRGFFPSENGRITCVARKRVCRHHTGFSRTKTVAFHAIGPHLHVVEKMSFSRTKTVAFHAIGPHLHVVEKMSFSRTKTVAFHG